MLQESLSRLYIPVQVSQLVHNNGLTKPFSIFLFLKMYAGDKVKADDEVFSHLRSALYKADPKNRSFKKHFKTLRDINWIGFNPKTLVYHIRSFDYIRAVNTLKSRKATKLYYEDLLQLKTYIPAVLICDAVRAQQYFWEKGKGRSRAAAKRDAANQPKTCRRPSHFGLSNRRIGKMLGCSQTMACKIKKAAQDAGYLKASHRYDDIYCTTEADYSARANLAVSDPMLAKRIRIITKTENGQKVIKFVRQLFDHIEPLIASKRVIKFSALHIALPKQAGIASMSTLATAA